MGKGLLNRTVQACGILVLFIVSSVTPMVIGYNADVSEDDEYFEKLAHANYDEYDPLDFDYYDEMSQRENIENIASGEIATFYKSPQTALTEGPMDSAWPMKCHDSRHTGLSPYNTINNTGFEKWRFFTDNGIICDPIIDNDGTIYFGGSYEGLPYYLIALNPNGTLKWRFRTNGLIFRSSAAIDEDGTIYIGSWDAGLYAINPNGTLKWRFSAGAIVAASPTIGNNGTIYIGNANRRFFAINPNGTEKWHYDTGGDIYSDPAIADDGTIYIGSWDNYLYAFYPNGTLRWRFETGNHVKGPPSIAKDGTVYIGSFDGHLYALFPNNGTMKWQYSLAGTETNPSISDDGTIYVGGINLYAIYPNGTEKWSFDLGPDSYIHMSSPAISDEGIIYVGVIIGDSDGGEILAVYPNGTESWRRNIANFQVQSSPTIGKNGTIYIGSYSHDEGYPYGYLYAFGEGESNNPPSKPTITGETNGKFGESYDYTFVSSDPEGSVIRYYIDWGDDTFEEWIGPFESGEEIVVSHIWEEQDTYIIRAKAKDVYDAESEWGELEVTMPVNQQYSHSWFYWFLERFPNAFPILRNLLEL